MQCSYIWLYALAVCIVWSVAEHGSTNLLVQHLRPLLLRYNVTAYICGHDHNAQHIRESDSTVEYFVTGSGHRSNPSLRYLVRHITVIYILGLCNNGKTYISIMHGKIILIIIIISINDKKSIVHVFWIFVVLKLLCIATVTPHTCIFGTVHNSIQEFIIILIIIFIIFITIMDLI